ncbi:MAG: nicotinate-nucleotide--dimethylbenzimidazole phosphoribosyltransferase [Armatimonadota bacterium]|nr:nicotinate-nucleotide--dimethylbenzimidazole phosphoribosyltransferase [Armatimonadota bacterium]
MSTALAFASIPPFDQDAADAARARQNRLTKPTGSLGRLEDLTIQLAGIQGKTIPDIDPAMIFIYAGDHGVAAQGVSAYPAEVTAQMVYNFARGGAVINTLATQLDAKLSVADVGVAEDFPPELPIQHCKIRRGTADWTQGSAMSVEEARQALFTGQTLFQEAGTVGIAIVGEMGIGNTTTATALAAALTGHSPVNLVGRGTGIDSAGLVRKLSVIEKGLARHRGLTDPLDILAALGGLEIAAMAGTMLAAAAQRVPILLDGFITSVAALVASQLDPAISPYFIATHRSPEPGHTVVLDALGLTPLLDLGLRLGEASGAAFTLPLVRLSVAVLRDVATFDEAGVSEKGE